MKLLAVLSFPILTYGQSISGFVKDSIDKTPMAGVNIMINGKGAVTNQQGYYKLSDLTREKATISFSCIGYKKQTRIVVLQENDIMNLDILMIRDDVYLDEVVVSATRTENRISQVPGRINLITAERISLIAAQSIDEYLQFLPGVQVSRSFGILSTKSSVTMRGLSGNEQARTLVLLDGIPVNKADGGSVNWNLISTGDVERIEVVKGPGSALYGGNAMGGTINVLTRKPTKSIQGNLTAEYGTYNSRNFRINLGGKPGNDKEKGFYWTTSSFYQKSDGYITQSEADQKANPFIIKSNVNEKAMNFRFGYINPGKLNAEANITLYDGIRGTGEKVFQPEGNTTEYLTYQIRTNIGGTANHLKWNTALFYIDEHYLKVNEYQKDDYTWYEVESIRRDFGLLTSFNYSFTSHSITSGFDIRNGQVDASDIYFTSTDRVDNNGKGNFYGFYLQDEISVNQKLKLLAGLRYDLARFYDGQFRIYNPSAETTFLRQYEFADEGDEQWGAFSPRLSIQFRPNDQFRLYSSYSRGFRPSVLDDLCRTGRIKGGLKVANPNLKPEYLDNIEVGFDISPFKKIRISASLFTSKGKDFLYYVSTGDSIDMGYGERPIMIRSNISNVNIYGIESDFTYNLSESLSMFGNYAFTQAKISDYKPLSHDDPVSLKNKYLTDVPQHSFAFGLFLKSKVINAGLSGRYTGEMYVNDQNLYDDIVLSDRYPAWFTFDIKLSHEFFNLVNTSINVQNILDKKIYDSKGAVGPGRFITFQLTI